MLDASGLHCQLRPAGTAGRNSEEAGLPTDTAVNGRHVDRQARPVNGRHPGAEPEEQAGLLQPSGANGLGELER
jgi:hypothetical protein